MTTRLPHKPLLAVLALALVLRLVAGASFAPVLLSDDKDYVELAETLVHDGAYSSDGKPTAYRPPGYPFFLASVFAVTDKSLLAVRLIQAIIDTLTCLLVYRLAARRMQTSTATMAALVYAVFPLQIAYTATILTEVVVTFLLIASVTIITERNAGNGWLFAGGVLAGIAVLVRPVALVIPIAVLFSPSFLSLPARAKFRPLSVVCAGLMLALLPWLMRNTFEFGRPLITTNTGVNFWIGHHEGANGSFSFPPGNPLTRIDDEVERSDEGFRLGVGYICSEPISTVVVAGKKFAHLFGIDYWVLMSLHNIPGQEPGMRAVDSYRRIPAWSIVLTHGPVILLCLLSLVSMWGAAPEVIRKWLWLGVLLCLWIAIHLVFFGGARYRFPLHPVLVVTAVHGWAIMQTHTWKLTPLRVSFGLLIALLLIAGWTAELTILLAG